MLDDPELLLLREDPPEDLALGAGLELRDLSGARAAGAGELPLERPELGTVALGTAIPSYCTSKVNASRSPGGPLRRNTIASVVIAWTVPETTRRLPGRSPSVGVS